MMLRNCTPRYELNRTVPPEYSRDLLRALARGQDDQHDKPGRRERHPAALREAKELDDAPRTSRSCAGSASRSRCSMARAASLREPALAQVREKIAGGLRLPDDETGDCFKFTQALAAAARQRGVEFRYGTTIDRIALEGDRVNGDRTDRGTVSGDAYVVSAGSYSPLLLKPIGIRLPVYPVRAIRSPWRSPTHRAPGSRAWWTRPTRSRSPASATASGSAAWPSSRATISNCGSAAPDSRARAARPVPEGRRCRQRELLVRPAADDAGRPAGAGPVALPTSDSTPGTARWGGPWPAAPAGCWRT